MARRNRVDPWGDLWAVEPRGLLTGNRGCLVDEHRALVRHHRGDLWIACLTEYRGWRHELDQPRRWTPLFFLDDAVALAAGHRPCGLCRRDQYRAYRDAVRAAVRSATRLRASELNRRLAAERLRRGRGLERGNDRRTWSAPISDLPVGTMFVGPNGGTRVVLETDTMAFAFDGWSDRRDRTDDQVSVLTPPTSVAALAGGYQPLLHPSVLTPGRTGPVRSTSNHRSVRSEAGDLAPI
jgi:hypothetical protein